MEIYGASVVAFSSSVDLSGMDIETAIMLVQSQRAQLLEDGLRDQMDGIHRANLRMSELDNKITDLNKKTVGLEAENASLGSQLPELKDLLSRLSDSKDPDPERWSGLSWGQGDDPALSHQTLEQVKLAGLTIPTGDDAPRDVDKNGTMDAKGRVVQSWIDELSDKIQSFESKITTNTKTIENNNDAVTETRKQIDSLSSTQQLDMLRLQGLSNKRNEAFDLMTNVMKKLQDSRSSIVGNMR